MNLANGRQGGTPSTRPEIGSSGAHARAAEPEEGEVEKVDASPRRLDVILRSLPESELDSLIHRMGIRVDPGKRIDGPSQVARALVGLPDVRDTSRLSASSRELLHRIAEAG